MKSIKPGRGPSMMGGIGSAIIAVAGIGWTIGATAMGAPPFFALFGLCFIAIAIVQAIYNFKNAGSKNRYSSFDITDEHEEPDPLNQRFNPSAKEEYYSPNGSEPTQFCPYCGTKAEQGFEFCRSCGKKLP